MKPTSKLLLFGTILSLGVVLAQTTVTVLVNGKTSKLETLQKNGKVFVDGLAFAKALGANAKLEAGKLVVTTAGGAVYTQGTTQQAGGIGELGKAYTLGKESSALNFTLRSAEFLVARQVIGTDIIAPKPSEKLLVLHCTIQNPQKQEAYLSNGQIKLTAVDSSGENHVRFYYFAREGNNKELSLYLKPGQKLDVVSAIVVPAAGAVPKLIVENGQANNPVVRYDLSKSIKGLPAPYADPKDPFNAPNTVSVKTGQYYPDTEFDFKLESVAFSSEKLDDNAPKEGKRFLLATFSARNPINNDDARYLLALKNNLEFTVTDANDDPIRSFNGEWYKPSSPQKISTFPNLAYNQESKFRVAFELSQKVNAKTLTLTGKLRNFVFDVGNAK